MLGVVGLLGCWAVNSLQNTNKIFFFCFGGEQTLLLQIPVNVNRDVKRDKNDLLLITCYSLCEPGTHVGTQVTCTQLIRPRQRAARAVHEGVLCNGTNALHWR